jgi:formylglycine-generating enzyme required for sulfatase activity
MWKNSILALLIVNLNYGLSQNNIVDNMVFIEGDKLTKNQGSKFILDLNKDTTKIYPRCEVTHVDNFFISKHEVTNAEYRSFVNWVFDSIRSQSLFPDSVQKNELTYNYTFFDQGRLNNVNASVHIYPDTLAWMKYFNANGGGFDVISDIYFWHPSYDNYPVIGVSWAQANAYCHWRSERFKEYYQSLGKKEKKYFKPQSTFRLPSEAEWELAARDYEKIDEANDRWIINGFQRKNGEFIANVGSATYEGEFPAFNLWDDGAFYTQVVMHYASNISGIHDMLGNVSEWTSDIFDWNQLGLESILDCENLTSLKINLTKDSGLVGNIYITNPYTNETVLVAKNSPEHNELIEIRKEFFKIYPADSKEVIIEKYLGFFSVDSAYWDNILAINYPEKPEVIEGVLLKSDDIESAIQDHYLYNNCTGELVSFNFFKNNVEKKIESYAHNFGVYLKALGKSVNMPNVIIVKGGSWKDAPLYVNSGSVELYNESEQLCSIGFRVAMDTPYQTDFLSRKDKKRVEALRRFNLEDNSEDTRR